MSVESTADTFQLAVARGLAVQPLVGVAILEGQRFAYANARFAGMFGYRPDAVLTIPAIETVAYSSRLRVNQYLRERLAEEAQAESIEYEGVKNDGSPVHVQLFACRLDVNGKRCLLCLVTDISEQKAAERKIQSLTKRLAELTLRDPLTSLYNRRFTEASLERELRQAERSHALVSLVMCDVDGFRTVNESFGREAGDEVLKRFSLLLRQCCRESDIVCRYGGDEFLMVFPGMPADVATRWAEKVRASVAGARVTHGPSDLKLTASFGVATYPFNGLTWQELIAAADSAQYAANAAGGNQIGTAAPRKDPAPERAHPGTPAASALTLDEIADLAAREG